jgi:multidrug efflux pump subunit AcrA (membrane-fusion protein)
MFARELTRLSSRVAGEVITVAVQDFQRVKAGDLLVQIDPPTSGSGRTGRGCRRRTRQPSTI